MIKSIKIYKVISMLFIVSILLITYLPIIVIILTSFSNDKFGISMSGFTFNWYVQMFKSRSLLNSIIFTLQVSIISTILSILFGTLSAIGIHSLSKKNKKRFIILNNIPILNADIVTAAFLLIIFQVSSFIFAKNIMGTTTTIIAHVLFSTPYLILSIIPKLSELNENIFDAASDLGCSSNQVLFKVIIPNIKTGIIAGGMLAFTMSIDDFIITYFVSGDNLNFSTWLYSSLKTLRNGLWNQACAYNSLLIIITFVVVIGFNVYSIKRKDRKVLM